MLSLAILLTGCINNNMEKDLIVDSYLVVTKKLPENSTPVLIQNKWGYKEVSQIYLDSLLENICTLQNYEFTDLYPWLYTIPKLDSNEHLILLDLLKRKDFKQLSWGRGNWEKGAQIVSYTMTNGKYTCQIDKLYYTTDKEGLYRVTERIKRIE